MLIVAAGNRASSGPTRRSRGSHLIPRRRLGPPPPVEEVKSLPHRSMTGRVLGDSQHRTSSRSGSPPHNPNSADPTFSVEFGMLALMD
ncbi:hypothetical protein ZWY2020_001969 [Hordeum vulgare]|nr:hypothetical protein ZWY2020_001969 [Hordeum vulgare]